MVGFSVTHICLPKSIDQVENFFVGCAKGRKASHTTETDPPARNDTMSQIAQSLQTLGLGHQRTSAALQWKTAASFRQHMINLMANTAGEINRDNKSPLNSATVFLIISM